MPLSSEVQAVHCPNCQRKYNVRPEQIGRTARCKCGHVFKLEPAEQEMEEAQEYELTEANELPPAVSRLPAPDLGVACAQHPEVPAVVRCRQCHTPICATCDFVYPGNIHLCPSCATRPNTSISSKRKGLAVTSIVLAVWATMVTAVVLSGALAEFITSREAQEVIGLLIMLFGVAPCMAGLGVGLASRDKRFGNPVITWIGWIWNAVIMVLWFFLIIVGMMAQ